MMLKNIFATLIVLSSLALTGCTMANRPKVEKYPNLTKTEEIIIKGKSDIRDVREIFGAPTVKGRTLNEDHLVLGYAIMSYKEFGDSSLKSRLLNALTLKEADCWSTTFTQKNVYFKFDKDNKVEDIKYRGYAWTVPWNSFNFSYFQVLSDEEFKSTEPITPNQLVESFSSKNLSDESFEKYELKYDGKGVIFLFDLCCKGGNKVFDHQVKFEEEVEPAENYDGVKSSLLFDSIEFNYRENSKSDN